MLILLHFDRLPSLFFLFFCLFKSSIQMKTLFNIFFILKILFKFQTSFALKNW